MDDLLQSPCGPYGVEQTHIPSVWLFALHAKPTAALDQLPTDCLAMITGRTKQMRVVGSRPWDLVTPVLGTNDSDPAFTMYFVCSDTEWEHTTWFSKFSVGPVQTWMVFINHCPLRPAQVQLTINRTGAGQALSQWCPHSAIVLITVAFCLIGCCIEQALCIDQ